MAKSEVHVERLRLSNLEGAEEAFEDACLRSARLFHEHVDECDEEGRGPFALKDGCIESGFTLSVTFRHDPVRGTTDVVVDANTKLPKARTRLGHVLLANDKFVVEKDDANSKKSNLVDMKDAAK